MTSQSPRIYIYKITFEEVPYYYYGVHKEKVFDEEYWGSPYTHKWYWELYTPKKQILQLFDFTDEGWIEAKKVEQRLIKPVFNMDKWCLNENCGGRISLELCRKAGSKGGEKTKELGLGIFSLTKEQRKENSSKVGKKSKENKTGIFTLTTEQRKEIGSKTGKKLKELGLGIFFLTPEERIENSSKGGKIGGKVSGNQKWMCLETGHITNAGALTRYQKHRGIDTSKRKRIT